MIDKIKSALNNIADVDTDVNLSDLTTLRIGGKAKFVVYPKSDLALDNVFSIAKTYNLPYKVIGKGSNLLCSDDYYEGIIIRLDRYFNEYYFQDGYLTAQAGCSIISLSYEAMKNGLSGLEFASGIPATVGGVTFMNAGAYKASMSDIIDSVYVYKDGERVWMPNHECEFGYRQSFFQKNPNWIILATKMKLHEENPETIRSLVDDRRQRRMSTQPLDKFSAGSVFRNPDDIPAWKLIDGIGYRGKRIGGAMVSEKHPNFLVNEDGASARDFLTLVEAIQQEVSEKYGIDLCMEVEKFNWK